ncbi:MAG: hypothetical protein ACC661_06980, partial [Verrucomicrobiales bacterium]
VRAEMDAGAAQLLMLWDSVSARTYHLMRSLDLENWQELTTFAGDGLEQSFPADTGAFPRAFFTIVITQP